MSQSGVWRYAAHQHRREHGQQHQEAEHDPRRDARPRRVISGSWIASACVEMRKVVSPPRGAARISSAYSTVKIASAIGAFQLRTSALTGVVGGERAVCE